MPFKSCFDGLVAYAAVYRCCLRRLSFIHSSAGSNAGQPSPSQLRTAVPLEEAVMHFRAFGWMADVFGKPELQVEQSTGCRGRRLPTVRRVASGIRFLALLQHCSAIVPQDSRLMGKQGLLSDRV